MRQSCLLLLIVLVCTQCNTDKKLGIALPEGISQERKQALRQQFAAGKQAYLTHCSGCHNKTIQGKSIIPDFTFQQTYTYKVRFSNNPHKNTLRQEAITEQELDNIVVFFTYKKASGVPPFDHDIPTE